MDPIHPLERLRAKLSAPTESYLNSALYARLSTVEYKGRLHVDFFGSPLDAPYAELCEILRSLNVANKLSSLVLRTPDDGANGTCNWDLSGLVEAETVYPTLRLLSIQQNGPSDHNRMIVGDAVFDEAGVLGTVIRKAPVLDALITPSAPNKTFFDVRNHPLRHLSVDAGYDTQNFIAHLAESKSFPGLESLEFGEYNETYLETFPQGCTPFADYQRLFRSCAFASVRRFTWRNPMCAPAEIEALRARRPSSELAFKIVRFSQEYLRG